MTYQAVRRTPRPGQPCLFAQLAALPWRQVPVAHQVRERGHGRTERRTLKVTDTLIVPGQEHFFMVAAPASSHGGVNS